MSESGGEEPKTPKAKPALVRLGQNGRSGIGTPRTPGGGLPGRLSSFKAPRDLTLGSPAGKQATERKKFVPNLNVQRSVKKESDEVKPHERKEDRRKGKNRERPDKRKDKPALIQTMGSIFSEGVGSTGGIRRRGGGGYSREGGEGGLQKPKLEMNIKYDKDEEEARLRELLRDDFIDDLTTGGYVPVQLPMVDTGKIFKEQVKKEKNDPDGDTMIKPSQLSTRPTELDSDDDADDIKPDVKPPPNSAPLGPPPEVSMADLVKTQKGDLLFIQLPDHLPGQGMKQEIEGQATCGLAGLEEGCLGKLQIRASGACQLVLGEHQVLDVEVGTRVGFLQDAVSVRTGSEEKRGEMTVLGHVKHRLVVTPNWDHLLRKSGLNPGLA